MSFPRFSSAVAGRPDELAAVLEAWTDRLDSSLEGWHRFARQPVELRAALRNSLRALQRIAEADFLLLLFGSLGRGEQSQDLDLLVVIRGEYPAFRYRRVHLAGIQCDLNIATLGWLREAPGDAEWGYWLTESYLLAARGLEIEAAWLESANRYWSPRVRDRRLRLRLALLRKLVTAATHANDSDRPLAARCLTHEAARLLANVIIEETGRRPFSHRSLVGGLLRGLRQLDVSPAVGWNVLRALLGGFALPRSRARETYIELRVRLSAVLRSLPISSGYSPARNQEERLTALVDLAIGPEANCLERILKPVAAGFSEGSWVEESLGAINAVVEKGQSFRQSKATVRYRPATAPMPPGTMAQVDGARWLEMTGKRLKVIVNTGGCKTPSCTFCALPKYGQRLPVRGLAATVRDVLETYGPDELAVYNDGSLLNPAEVSREERLAMCAVIREHHVSALTIESIPRFVHPGVIREMLFASGVGELTVSMGLQCVSDSVAVSRLGRPDVDAHFDRAVDVVVGAGAKVRLYVLWNPPLSSEIDRVRLFSDSLRWTLRRPIHRVTVCPWIDPSPAGGSVSSDLCGLLRELCRLIRPIQASRAVVDVSLPARPSCASLSSDHCPKCAALLREGPTAWIDGPAGCLERFSGAARRVAAPV
jgi:hypothetical protein